MFSKRPESDDSRSIAPVPQKPGSGTFVAPPASKSRQTQSAPSGVSMIGPDLSITGNLVSEGAVVVDGVVQGDIHCDHLTVGENAQITGGIVAREIVVRGQVMGSVRGMQVKLQATSRVEGDIYHNSLSIEQGALFEGRSRRVEDPLATAQRQEMPLQIAPSGAVRAS